MDSPTPEGSKRPGAVSAWERHSRTTLLDTSSYRIHRDRVTQPDGRLSDFEFHEADCDGAVTVAQDLSGKIALVRYPSYVHGEILTPPGGSLEPGETPLAGAQRELREEAGITARAWTSLGQIALMTKCTARLHMFAAQDLTLGEQQLSGTETGMTLEWWSLQDAVAAAMDGRLLLSGAALSVLMLARLTDTR
jgi:hypothetical protein